MYCDRFNTDIPKSQCGFIKNICLPLFEAFCFYLQSSVINNNCLDQLKTNYNSWTNKSKSDKIAENGFYEEDNGKNDKSL